MVELELCKVMTTEHDNSVTNRFGNTATSSAGPTRPLVDLFGGVKTLIYKNSL